MILIACAYRSKFCISSVTRPLSRPLPSDGACGGRKNLVDAEHERSICQRYSNRIRSYGLCHLRDSAAAEDLMQQVLLVVLQALRAGRVKEVDHLDTYVFGTCRNMVMDMPRGNARQRRIAGAVASGIPHGHELPWALPDRSRLVWCLA